MGGKVFANHQLVAFHTYSEAVALVREMRERKISSVGVVAPAFHLCRAYISTVSAVIAEKGEPISVFGICGGHQSWRSEVVHSQGTTKGTRDSLIDGEIERIGKYDNLLPPGRVLEYMRVRDLALVL